MKALVYVTLAVSALASPALSFAQATNAPLTRAEVRADLVRIEQAGYNPSSSDDANYPADVQAAEAKVAAQNAVPAVAADDAAATTSMGTDMSGSSASGARMPMHRMSGGQSCVGPVDFCTPYFGS